MSAEAWTWLVSSAVVIAGIFVDSWHTRRLMRRQHEEWMKALREKYRL